MSRNQRETESKEVIRQARTRCREERTPGNLTLRTIICSFNDYFPNPYYIPGTLVNCNMSCFHHMHGVSFYVLFYLIFMALIQKEK